MTWVLWFLLTLTRSLSGRSHSGPCGWTFFCGAPSPVQDIPPERGTDRAIPNGNRVPHGNPVPPHDPCPPAPAGAGAAGYWWGWERLELVALSVTDKRTQTAAHPPPRGQRGQRALGGGSGRGAPRVLRLPATTNVLPRESRHARPVPACALSPTSGPPSPGGSRGRAQPHPAPGLFPQPRLRTAPGPRGGGWGPARKALRPLAPARPAVPARASPLGHG